MNETYEFVHKNPDDQRSLLIPAQVAQEMENPGVPPSGLSAERYALMAQREVMGTDGHGSIRAETTEMRNQDKLSEFAEQIKDKEAADTNQFLEELKDPSKLLQLKDTVEGALSLIYASGSKTDELKKLSKDFLTESVKGYVNRLNVSRIKVPESFMAKLSKWIELPREEIITGEGLTNTPEGTEEPEITETDHPSEPEDLTTPETAPRSLEEVLQILDETRSRYAEITAGRRASVFSKKYSKEALEQASGEYRIALEAANTVKSIEGEDEAVNISLDVARAEARLIANQTKEAAKRYEDTSIRKQFNKKFMKYVWNSNIKFTKDLIEMPPREDPRDSKPKHEPQPPISESEDVISQIDRKISESDATKIDSEYITALFDRKTGNTIRDNRLRALGSVLISMYPAAKEYLPDNMLPGWLLKKANEKDKK